MKRLLLILLLFAGPAFAQSRIDQLGAGSALSGTESFPTCQGCGASTPAVGVTANQIKTFIGGSAMTLISTQTANNSATLQWTGLGSTYNTLLLDCNGIIPVSSANRFVLQYGEGATPTWNTTGNYWYAYLDIVSPGGTTGGAGSESAGFISLTHSDVTTTANWAVSAKAWISNVGSSTVFKNALTESTWKNATDMARNVGMGTWQADASPITAIRVEFASGNIASGQCSLYGLTP